MNEEPKVVLSPVFASSLRSFHPGPSCGRKNSSAGMVFAFAAFYPNSCTSQRSSVNNITENSASSELVLASQSPVRAMLLRQAGLAFRIVRAAVDEAALLGDCAGMPSSETALHLADCKALNVARQNPQALVVGADQLLVLDEAILQKPANMQAARQRLDALSGRSHQLVTAVVLAKNDRIIWKHVETAILTMQVLSPEEIACHMEAEGDAVLQSVGAYRLEGPGIRLFAALEGDYFSMLGLPLVPLLGALRQYIPHLLPGSAST